uniref:DUF4201 domain-containing protein n=1 Tax=Bactrocera latifrons TaxID=174628 RepID=A0A0K8U5B2_BACLA
MKKKRLSKKILGLDNIKKITGRMRTSVRHIGLAVPTIGYQPVEEFVRRTITDEEQTQNRLLRIKSQYKITDLAQESREQVIEYQEPEDKTQTEVIYSTFSYISLLRKLELLKKRSSPLKSHSSTFLQSLFPLPDTRNMPKLEDNQSSTESTVEQLTDINSDDTNEALGKLMKTDDNENSTEMTSETIEDDELLTFPSNYLETEMKKELNYEDIRKITLENREDTDEEEPNKSQILSHVQDSKNMQLAFDMEAFLSALIADAVDKYEPNKFRQHNLDKPLLLNELIEKLTELEFERKNRMYLIKGVGMFCNSKGQHRVFAEDAPHNIETLKQNYQEALMKLDRSLGKEENLKREVHVKKTELERKLSMFQNKNDTKLLELERLVEETFGDKKEHLKMIVKSELSTMRKVRDEVSARRCELIRKQHTHFVLKEKADKFRDLSDSVTYSNYEQMHGYVQELEKKLRGKNILLYSILCFNIPLLPDLCTYVFSKNAMLDATECDRDSMRLYKKRDTTWSRRLRFKRRLASKKRYYSNCSWNCPLLGK